MNQSFILNSNLNMNTTFKNEKLEYAISRFQRDIHMTLNKTDEKGNHLSLVLRECEKESFQISVLNNEEIELCASDDLGFIYGLLYISEKYLGVKPFWFWNDQEFTKRDEICIPCMDYKSSTKKVNFRGWFINDEVLIDHWSIDTNKGKSWEMALEALLRSGGNMVIPGTDKNSKLYRDLADKMGLWITHHHAEPLGAEMFARVYPELNPSYDEHPDLFYGLWEEGIKEQKDKNIIWNLGFRGQGDCPFWSNDPRYVTSASRGELISSIIKKQYDLVLSYNKDAICCTNLYGESMELYREGHLHFPEEIIKIWADNGYGKMVSRRQENNNPRVYALPDGKSNNEHHGMYYHVSFYDLQAANHMTMQPNSLEFINKELTHAFSVGADDFLIVNCSNIKPHVYYLDAIREIWSNGSIDEKEQGKNYIKNYYMDSYKNSDENLAEVLIDEIYECFHDYARATVPFGIHEDERAGDQFYNFTTRMLSSYWFKGEYKDSIKRLHWATGDIPYIEQVNWFLVKCRESKDKFIELYHKCEKLYDKLLGKSKQLFFDSIFLQVKIHLNCIEGSIAFNEAFLYFDDKSYYEAFYLLGNSSEYFNSANEAMRNVEHDKWEGFYSNECLCDIKQTAYVLKHLMSYVRNVDDGPSFNKWQREFLYEEEDKRVVLLTNTENHLMDDELYDLMKKKKN